MSIIKIAGKKFKLASRWSRLGAFLLDIGILGFCQALLMLSGFALYTTLDGFNFDDASDMTTVSIATLSVILWGFGLFYMDGFQKGGGFGKKLLSLQVVRVEDGKPANFKDASFVALLVYSNPSTGYSQSEKRDSGWVTNLRKQLSSN